MDAKKFGVTEEEFAEWEARAKKQVEDLMAKGGMELLDRKLKDLEDYHKMDCLFPEGEFFRCYLGRIVFGA